jgi:hypothetical protein
MTKKVGVFASDSKIGDFSGGPQHHFAVVPMASKACKNFSGLAEDLSDDRYLCVFLIDIILIDTQTVNPHQIRLKSFSLPLSIYLGQGLVTVEGDHVCCSIYENLLCELTVTPSI